MADSSIEVIALQERATLADLEAVLGRLPANRLRGATAFAFRVPESFIKGAAEIRNRPLRAAADRRSSGKPIYLVWFESASQRIAVSRLARPGHHEYDEDLVTRIRQADLLQVLRTTGRVKFFRSSSSYHFVDPNRQHTRVFLRVGDAIASQEALETFAFWLCPAVAKSSAIILDTWSIAAVPLRAMHLVNQTVPLDCLSFHPRSEPDKATRILARTIERLSDGRILFLTSVAANAELLGIMRMILDDLNQSHIPVDWATLYAYANAPTDQEVDVFCRLGEDYVSWPAGDCPDCESKSRPIPLDPQAFHLTSSEIEALPLDPRRGYFSTGQDFIGVYGNISGVLRAHRDDPNDGVHHAFYVDVKTLLETQPFLESLVQALDQTDPRPDFVVAPDHDAGRALARIASERYGVPALILNDLRRSHLDHAAVRLLDQATCAMILDDVLKSGSRLVEFTRALREEHRPLAAVHYLVGVSRPDSEKSLASTRSALTRNNTAWKATLRHIVSLLLPAWGSDNCPWCREFEALSRVAERLPKIPSWLLRRLQQLTSLRDGVLRRPFFLGPEQDDKTLGDQSPAGPAGLSSIGTLFSFSSALQAMRTADDERYRLHPGFPLSKAFAARNLKNYSENLPRLCLLRLVRAGEWHPEACDDPKRLFLGELENDPNSFGEFLMALARRALSPYVDDDLLSLAKLSFGFTEDDVRRLLR